MARAEAFLVLPVAALHLAVVPGCVWTDGFMPYTPRHSGKQFYKSASRTKHWVLTKTVKIQCFLCVYMVRKSALAK